MWHAGALPTGFQVFHEQAVAVFNLPGIDKLWPQHMRLHPDLAVVAIDPQHVLLSAAR